MTGRTLLAAALAAMLVTPADAATRLSFEQVLARAEAAHDVSPSALAAADLLETPPRISFPILRIETSATSANSVDFLARNVFRYDALTSLLSVDYPLIDGGVREQQMRLARLDARTFRHGLRETSENLFRETVEAVARLYAAQERMRILNAGLARAMQLRDRAAQQLQMQEISNVTAAQWEDEAFAAESQLLDLELQRLEAETHVRQLMGDTSGEPIEIILDLGTAGTSALAATPDSLAAGDPGVRSSMSYERAKLALAEAEAARKPQLLMSAFGGVTAFDDVGDGGGYGIFGLRFTISLPMFDRGTTRRVAEARLRAEEADLARRSSDEQIRRQASILWLGITSLEKRIGLLQQMVDVAKRREESITRLAAAGVRPENDVADAAAERARRESNLLGARVDLWKYQQIVNRRRGAER